MIVSMKNSIIDQQIDNNDFGLVSKYIIGVDPYTENSNEWSTSMWFIANNLTWEDIYQYQLQNGQITFYEYVKKISTRHT